MKKTFLTIAAFLLCVSGSFAQNFNVNLGGIQWTSGPSVPTSCSRDGSWFYKNVAPKGWSQCNGGVYGSGSATAGVVYAVTTTAQTTATGIYATVYTTPAAGIYEVTGNIYATTASSTAYTVGVYATAVQVNEISTAATSGMVLSQYNVGVTPSQVSSVGIVYLANLGSGVAIQVATNVVSGTNTSGVWNYTVVIKRLQ